MDKLAKVRAEVARIQLYTQSEVLKQVLDYIDEVQKEPVIQNIITEPVGFPTGAVELANIPDKRSPTNEEIGDYDHKAVMESLHPQLKEEPVSEDLEEVMQRNAPDNIGIDDLLYWRNGFITGTKWQKTKDESTTEDFGKYINELSKQFPEVSFAKLSRIAVRVAKWQKQKEYTCYEEAFEDGAKWKKEQMMEKAIDAEVLENYDGKVLEYDDSILDEKLSDCKVFDKVKVIVIKEE